MAKKKISPGKKAAATRKKRATAKKAATTRKRRSAAKKAVQTKKANQIAAWAKAGLDAVTAGDANEAHRCLKAIHEAVT